MWQYDIQQLILPKHLSFPQLALTATNGKEGIGDNSAVLK